MDSTLFGQRQVLARLITSAHILHHHKILDEVGTISIRNTVEPHTFISSSLPAVLISSPSDLEIYNVADASPVLRNPAENSAALQTIGLPNPEIFIHSSIYARYPDIMSIAHITTTDLVVYGLCDSSGSMMRSVFNQAGFIDDYSPIFDPALHRALLPINHPENLQIDHPALGAALAETLDRSARSDGFARADTLPAYSVAFIRGNGAVVCSQGLEDTVCKSVKLQRNALVQTAAMLQRDGTEVPITYLSDSEAKHCSRVSDRANSLSWKAWAAETFRCTMYRNELADSV